MTDREAPPHAPAAVHPPGAAAGVLDDALQRVTDGIVVLGRDWRYLYLNPAAEALLGRRAEELVGRDYRVLFPEALDQPFYQAYRQAMETGEPAVFEEHYAPWDRWFENRLYPGAHGLTILFTEVTTRRRAEAELRAREARQGLVLRGLAVGSWAWDFDTDRLVREPSLAALVGLPAGQALEISGAEFLAEVHPDDREAVRADLARFRTEGRPPDTTFRYRHADGHYLWLHATGEPLRAPHVGGTPGRITGGVGAVRDVTAEREALAALRATEAHVETVFELVGSLLWTWDFATGAVWRRGNLLARLGYGPGDVPPEGPEHATWWLDRVHPDDQPAQRQRAAAMREGTAPPAHAEYRMRRADGRWATVASTVRVQHDAAGRPVRAVGIDIDASARAEAAREREALEAQLRQAQRMEAVGRLAGGVAHDFNNLLTLIRAHVRFALESAPPGGTWRDELGMVEQAAERAAGLTRQLLAFSRRQRLQPEVLDLNAVVRGLEPLLRRLIGEDIVVATRLAPALGAVSADPGQLEQVLVNLAVNARDAMPHGGRLEFATTEVVLGSAAAADAGADGGDGGDGGDGELPEPGRYVRLTVRDTGTGMDEATRARAFEPFFTTKEPGRGTGLGLSTVYGIVRQSGGWVRLASAPGRGTQVTVDLPRVDLPVPAPVVPPSTERPRGVGTVLVVEDEPEVRRVVQRMLARQGYTVLTAANGREAQAVVTSHAGPLDLVLTDAVMPEVSGRALAEWLATARPGVPVLFMSGYTDDEILRRGLEAPGQHFIGKPFTPEALLDAVRAALGR